MSKRDEVEAFLAGEVRHRLPAPASWIEVNRDGEYRLRLPVEVEGELSGFAVEVISAPDAIDPVFKCILLYERAIWRVCVCDVSHVNPLNRPAGVPAMLTGPHYHSWQDNRHTGAVNSLPKRLKNARVLDGFEPTEDAIFSWFLDQVKILPPEWDMPKWPTRTLLL